MCNSYKLVYTGITISIFQKFSNKLAKVIQGGNYLLIAYSLFYACLLFFQSLRKTQSLRQLLNNKESGFITEGPKIFSILIDIPSRP